MILTLSLMEAVGGTSSITSKFPIRHPLHHEICHRIMNTTNHNLLRDGKVGGDTFC